MPISVFLNFSFERNAARATQVCASGLDAACAFRGMLSRVEWLTLERLGQRAVMRWTDSELDASAVAVLLLAGPSAPSPWANYVIQRCRTEGKPMLAVHVHRLADPLTGFREPKAPNPFDQHFVTGSNPRVFLSEIYPTYDWVTDDGERNFPEWVFAAIADTGRRTSPHQRPAAGAFLPRTLAASPQRPVAGFIAPRHVSDEWHPSAWTPEL